MIESSKASPYLKAILAQKVENRGGGRRFFGEAFVATVLDHQFGYYGSFKWLTNPRFFDGRPFPASPTREFKEQFRDALLSHFGDRQMESLVVTAQEVERTQGVKPAAPDLWLIDHRGDHHFIEVKLLRDRVRPPQKLGLDLIASCLHPRTRLSIEIVELFPEGESS